MALFDLQDRVAIVTGGNGGIGLAMGQGMAQAGAAVVVAARDPVKGEAAVTALESLGVRSAFIALDVRDEASCVNLIETVVADFGRVDVLVNNAGTNDRKQPEEYALAEWQAIIDTNLTSAFMLSQRVYPVMKNAGGGKIINIGSMMSIFGASFTVPYASSKGGIVQMPRVWPVPGPRTTSRSMRYFQAGSIPHSLAKQDCRSMDCMKRLNREHPLGAGACRRTYLASRCSWLRPLQIL